MSVRQFIRDVRPNNFDIRNVHLDILIDNQEQNQAWGKILPMIIIDLSYLQRLHISIQHSMLAWKIVHPGGRHWQMLPRSRSSDLCQEDCGFLAQTSMLQKLHLKMFTLVL